MWIAWLMVDRIAALAGGDSFAMSHSGELRLRVEESDRQMQRDSVRERERDPIPPAWHP